MSRSEYSDDCDGFHKQQIKDIAKPLLKDLLKAVAISLLAVLGVMAWSVIEILRR